MSNEFLYNARCMGRYRFSCVVFIRNTCLPRKNHISGSVVIVDEPTFLVHKQLEVFFVRLQCLWVSGPLQRIFGLFQYYYKSVNIVISNNGDVR